jgi:NADPH:quinone reductase-like Zn-dependent oxidoreductase
LLSSLTDAVTSGHLTVPIHRTYSLNEVPAATRDFAQEGTLGKLGIVVAR